MSDLDDIYAALQDGAVLAERAVYDAKGADAYDSAKWRRESIMRGVRAFGRLSSEMPRLRDLKAAADREYDRFVTREPEGCSCHISPPCSYCTREADEEQSDV